MGAAVLVARGKSLPTNSPLNPPNTPSSDSCVDKGTSCYLLRMRNAEWSQSNALPKRKKTDFETYVILMVFTGTARPNNRRPSAVNCPQATTLSHPSACFVQPANARASRTSISHSILPQTMAFCSLFEDFHVGQVLILSVIPEHGKACSTTTIRTRIRQLQDNRTLSCCMILDILDKGYPDEPVFLKLYDRRFSDQFRRDHGVDPWTRDTEKAYINTVRTGVARQFLHNLHTVPSFEKDTGNTWDDGQIETFLTGQAHQLFDAEAAAYDSLGDIQGKLVPRLMARVHLAISLPDAGMIGTKDVADLLDIRGILLQYIDGFSLSKVQDHAPKSAWQGIVDRAVAIVQVVGDHGILNRDVRPNSFIVQRDGDGPYRVFMIDFGLARLRERDESDRDWAKAKLTKDEEGAVGLVMRKRLAREGFELRFEESDRYMEWAGGDDE